MKLEDAIRQPQFNNPQQRAGMNVIFTANWLSNQYATALKPIGLSLQQLNVLTILKGQPDYTAPVNLIKDRLIDRMPNVSRLLNKLMEKGLLRQCRRPRIRRGAGAPEPLRPRGRVRHHRQLQRPRTDAEPEHPAPGGV